MQVQLEELLTAIEKCRGQIFRVTFVKRTTGEERVMVCRQGVRGHLRGGEAPYSFREKGLLPVFDMQKQGYRTVPAESITSARVNGVTYSVR